MHNYEVLIFKFKKSSNLLEIISKLAINIIYPFHFTFFIMTVFRNFIMKKGIL